MQNKISPLIVRILYLMSVSNLMVMTICIFAAMSINFNIQYSTIPAFTFLATMLDVALGYLSRAINNAGFVFVLVNSFLSILMWFTARFLSHYGLNPVAVNNLNFVQAKK